MTDKAMENIVSCAVCGNNNLTIRHRHAVGDRTILRCGNCGTWVLWPFTSKEDRERLYQDNYYDRWGYEQNNIKIISHMKKRLYEKVLKEIEIYIRPSRLLDIGCAMGFSLEIAQERGWQPHGIEISKFAGNIAKEKFGDVVKVGDIQDADFGNNYFDAITMIDLLEHVEDPLAVLSKIKGVLKKDGVLVILVPDTCSLSSRIMRAKWPHINAEHLFYYSRKSIQQLLFKIGFDVRIVKPFPKPMSLFYIQNILKYSQFKLIHIFLNFIYALTPKKLRTIDFYLPTGEMLIIAGKMSDEKHF